MYVCAGVSYMVGTLCNDFHHFANHCPNKIDPSKCGKCSGQQKKGICRSKFFKCLNCIKAKVNSFKYHEITSRYCPILIAEQTQIQKRTNYSHENN